MHLALAVTLLAAAAPSPLCHRVECPASPEEARRVLERAAAARDWIEVSEIGRSAGDRPLLATRLGRSPNPTWRLLLIGQQHGDEPAGGTALVHLVDAVATSPERLPAHVELWVVPVVNPDGAVAGERVNAAGADLNRDHLTLSQPETRALHRLARAVRPHLVVDCHEFTRDSAAYRRRGWTEWPLVMMDSANLPWLPPEVLATGLEWVEAARPRMAAAGFNYQRYLVGGPPPAGELRPSTLDADDARNGLALHAGALGFIIESGIHRQAPDPDHDLDRRVAATLELLDLFLEAEDLQRASLEVVDRIRHRPTPPFVPTNTLWGNLGRRIALVPVIRQADGAVRRIPTGNLMHDPVVKSQAATPAAYWVDAPAAAPYARLLSDHGVPVETLAADRSVALVSCTLERMEADFDPLYQRYGGRQRVACDEPAPVTMPAGSLRVAVDDPDGQRAVPVLDPRRLYGLYQFEPFRVTVSADGAIPVRLQPR